MDTSRTLCRPVVPCETTLVRWRGMRARHIRYKRGTCDVISLPTSLTPHRHPEHTEKMRIEEWAAGTTVEQDCTAMTEYLFVEGSAKEGEEDPSGTRKFMDATNVTKYFCLHAFSGKRHRLKVIPSETAACFRLPFSSRPPPPARGPNLPFCALHSSSQSRVLS